MKYLFTIKINFILLISSVLSQKNLVTKDWNPVQAADKVLTNLTNVTGPKIKGAHDAAFVIVGGRAYIIYEANDKKPGEAASWPFVYCAMTIFNIETGKIEKQEKFAFGEQKFSNVSLPTGACFVPRLIQKDEKTLRCFFSSEQPGKRQSQMWYRDFDLLKNEFLHSIHKVKIKTSKGVFDMQPKYFYEDAAHIGFKKDKKDFGLYILDSFKKIDNTLYTTVNNYPGKQNALAVLNDDFETIEIVGHYNEPQNLNLSESAVHKLPNGKWMAICRQDGGNKNYTVTYSQNGREWLENKFLPSIKNGTNSKPTFDKFKNIYYLGWQENRKIKGVFRSVFNIDVSIDGNKWVRKYTFESDRSFQYPVFYEYKGKIYIAVTQYHKKKIMFGILE